MSAELPAPTRPHRRPLVPAPVRVALPGRALLLVAGLPGAGKSTLLASLPAAPGLVVLDSDAHRAALGRRLPATVPYRRYRWLVHLLHRLAVVRAALSAAPTVVVHLPATQTVLRAALARLAAVTGREAHLLWLHVDPGEALRGQRERGRMVASASFDRHARRAGAVAARLRTGPRPSGWRTVSVLDRAAVRGGLRLDTTPAE